VELEFPGQVTCVSLSKIREGCYGSGKNILYIRQDATALPYADRSFEAVYSNSLLEHVGRENQHQVAAEIKRVGQSYWVQVPNRNFPVEPHYQALFFYQMPRRMRRWVATYWTSLVKKPNYYLAEVDTIWPLDEREMRTLFPGAKVMKEKVMGITKSFVAWQVEQ
jgi:ubiquinone/menaquinone biosynthesis C-methylase UbiE